MRSRKTTTQWNLFFHYISIALSIVSGVVLVPFYLKYIPIDLYGAWLAPGTILVWLTTIDPGLSTILQQRVGMAYGKNDFPEIYEWMTGGIFLSIIIVALLFVGGYWMADFIPRMLNLSVEIDFQV